MKAALRDASWHPNPDTKSPKRFHVIVDFEQAACGRHCILCIDDAIPVEDVPEGQRCMAPGCKKRWPGASDAKP